MAHGRRRSGDHGRAPDGDDGRRRLHPGGGPEEGLQRGDETPRVGAATDAAAERLALGRVERLETLRQRAAGAEDERLDRGLGQLHLLGDLAVREALPLAQQDRAALALRHLLQHALEPDELVAVVLPGRDDVLQQLEVARRLDPAAPERGAVPREADVLGDLEQPRRLGLRDDAALERAERVQERRLDCVLRLLPRAELRVAEAVQLMRVTLVERVRQLGFTRARRSLDGGCTTN